LKILEAALKEEALLNNPGSIFNVDESDNWLIIKAAAKKGAKHLYVLTRQVRWKNLAVIACFSSEGQFLASILISKLVTDKQEFADGLPHRPKV
jgi:hypothetical protein